MYRKLLVALDGSPFSEQALSTAAAVAIGMKAKLDLVLVHTPHPLVVEFDPQLEPTLRAEEERYLHTTAAAVKHRHHIHPHVAVLNGSPVSAICSYALEQGAELIVMTTHGRTGFSRAWLGSVADGVVRHADVPVLLLRSPEMSSPSVVAMPQAFRRILIPLDGSDAGAAILPHALALGGDGDATYLLTRIVPLVAYPPIDMGVPGAASAIVPDEDATQTLVDETNAYLSSIATRLRDGGVKHVETRVEVSLHPGPAIVALTQSRHIDLVAMTTHGRGASRLLVGSVADKILRGTGCAVLSYRPTAAA